MTYRPLILTALLVSTALAQTAAPTNRIVKIQGGARGNVRTGPLTYTGNPVKATISTLQLQSAQAVLADPTGAGLLEAEGKRTADFTGNVLVTRGRLTAKGGKLAYSEATGQGIMTGTPSATFVPANKEDGDNVAIQATQMSLDVDNNVSTSTGSVSLTNGTQTGKAEKLVFDEDKELAQLTGTPSLTRAAKGTQKELVISGTEVRARTKEKTLYVRGGVKLVQGTTTTTGDSVYYDDRKNVAYVVGNAVSIDSKTRVTLRAPASGYLEQRTDLARVRVLNSAYKIPTDQFKLRSEQ
ncbi:MULTISPECIES: LptA/OstA family protein [Deinococcus]|uniref:LptA/OstA family protein n=1 Tax=Deinococcus rufus TaxID=2136097 RepID=A0ABV7Z4W9_9DEIO|nr:LptA/OstA family protein [Deinococcus sp. AB2017081]WQE96531.1 LptA/OstA family protein [Deinococcus sp. AB2017081]